jgi:hypothetical protein
VALDVIRRVLANIVATPMAELEGGPLFVTFSAGVATQGGYERFADVQDLLRAADDVLYRSKNLGRNRVIARSPGALGHDELSTGRRAGLNGKPRDRGERRILRRSAQNTLARRRMRVESPAISTHPRSPCPSSPIAASF